MTLFQRTIARQWGAWDGSIKRTIRKRVGLPWTLFMRCALRYANPLGGLCLLGMWRVQPLNPIGFLTIGPWNATSVCKNELLRIGMQYPYISLPLQTQERGGRKSPVMSGILSQCDCRLSMLIGSAPELWLILYVICQHGKCTAYVPVECGWGSAIWKTRWICYALH